MSNPSNDLTVPVQWMFSNSEQSIPSRLSRLARLAGKLGAWIVSWTVVGLLVGWHQRETVGSGTVAVVSSMLAGAIVLTLAGLPLALFGGRVGDVLAGAAVGWLAGMTMEQSGSLLPVSSVPLGLVMGAIVGATLWPLVTAVSRIAHVASSASAYWRNVPPGPRSVS